jgi:Flp pilus assembly protein TadG
MSRVPRSKLARARSRGVAMVEFIIVLPVVLLVFVAVTEIGNVLLRYNTLTKAVHDGARHAAEYGRLGDSNIVLIHEELAAEIRNLIIFGNIAGTGEPLLDGLLANQITITVPEQEQVLVTAAYPDQPVFGLTLPSFGFGDSPSLQIDLSAAVRMPAL